MKGEGNYMPDVNTYLNQCVSLLLFLNALTTYRFQALFLVHDESHFLIFRYRNGIIQQEIARFKRIGQDSERVSQH
jgi:hypothetical protein